MFSSLARFFTLKPYWIALIISLFLLFWMLSGPATPLSVEMSTTTVENSLPKVQISRFTPQKMTKYLTLYGRSEANSHAVIRVKVAGEIIQLKKEKGDFVKNQQRLAYIEKSELPQRVEQAEALLAESLLNYNAVKSLNDKGLQGRVRLAEVKHLLLVAKTQLKQLQLQLQRTTVTAPFAGILQEQFAEKGDYLQIGDPIFSLENIDPIVIRGDATEHYINSLTLGQNVFATLLSGKKITGKISYIAAMADSKSSTFRIEAEFANTGFKILSGISAKLSIPLYPVQAVYVSPSVLAMDESGNLGVKLVRDGVVIFKEINLVEADKNGVWLSGFEGEVDIITLGQGFVKAGAVVQTVIAESL